MADFDLVVRAGRAVIDGWQRPAAVGVAGGIITAIEAHDLPMSADRTETLPDPLVLIPGLVDTHVHVNEPGHPDWEGFATATRAAAAGGITTLVDMPLDSVPVTTSVPALQAKRLAAHGRCHVDVGFWGGLVPGNHTELESLDAAGVLGFKCFLGSGTEAFPAVDADALLVGLRQVAELDSVLMVHAELDALRSSIRPASRSYADFVAARPAVMEVEAVRQVIAATRAAGARSHIVHVSTAQAVQLIAEARQSGAMVSAETCPHYLLLAAEHVNDGDTTVACNPPIREQANQDELWSALADGDICMVVSDHSPCATELKQLDSGDFEAAWGGISSLQLSLPLTWTAARTRGADLSDVVKWMATAPARLAGLSRKGVIAVGADADLVAFDPQAEFRVEPEHLHHRQAVTPYAGRSLRGVVRRTWLAGRVVDVHDPRAVPRGRLLHRHTA